MIGYERVLEMGRRERMTRSGAKRRLDCGRACEVNGAHDFCVVSWTTYDNQDINLGTAKKGI